MGRCQQMMEASTQWAPRDGKNPKLPAFFQTDLELSTSNITSMAQVLGQVASSMSKYPYIC